VSTARCKTCNRDPERMNSDIAECSHVDCPHRGRQWSRDIPRETRANREYIDLRVVRAFEKVED
jgi:hypothetical protein